MIPAHRIGRRHVAAWAVVFATALVGCGEENHIADGATHRTKETADRADRARGPIADVDFKNFTYDRGAPERESDPSAEPYPVTVVDGGYTTPDDPDPEPGDMPGGPFVVVVGVAYADLDADGQDEAAVSLFVGDSRSSGRGTLVYVYRSAPGSPGGAEYVTSVVSDDFDSSVNEVLASDAGDALVVRTIESDDSELGCCDGVVERTYHLDGERLVDAAEESRWAIVGFFPPQTGAEPAKFLPGPRRASVTGIIKNDPQSVTFKAVAGDRLELSVRDLGKDDVPFHAVVDGPGGFVGKVAAGAETDAWPPLTESGTYTIAAAPDRHVEDEYSNDGQPFWFDFELVGA